MFCIRKETEADYAAVENLVRIAFEGAEHTDGTEHELVARLRKSDEFVPDLSLVAEQDGKLAGHVMFTEVDLSGNKCLIMAPLAVLPEFQRKGCSSALVKEGLRKARAMNYPFVFVPGDPAYYTRFGFIPAADEGIAPPDGLPAEYFMAVKFAELPVDGTPAVRLSPAFG